MRSSLSEQVFHSLLSSDAQGTYGVGNFLHEIGKAKVLSKEEEVLLATHVQEHSRIARACKYFREQEGRDPTDLELCDLFGMVSGGMWLTQTSLIVMFGLSDDEASGLITPGNR